MTKMFKFVTETWNPVIGCLHNCTYCWARRLANGKLRKLLPKVYGDGFKPKLIPERLNRRFKPGSLVFVVDMGDLWGDWVPRNWILRVLQTIRRSPGATFLFMTKNPKRYHEFVDLFPENVIAGCTIETNRDYGVSKAPKPYERYVAMRDLPWEHKFISVEPIMDFDFQMFVKWIKDIGPELVCVGYDNYGCGLPEPGLSKTLNFIMTLRGFTKVQTKTLKR